MYAPNAFPDNLLLEAREDSLQLEQIAADDLKANLGDYLEPNYGARRMAEAYDRFVKSGGVNEEDEYLNMRAVYSETRGKSNKVFSDVIAKHIRPRKYDLTRSMFSGYVRKQGATADDTLVTQINGEDGEDPNADLWEKLINGAARHLEKFGWWKSRERVPEEIVENLATKCSLDMYASHGKKVDMCYEGKQDAPPQIKLSVSACSTYEELYQISADPFLLSIVQRYMGVPPIFNTPTAFLNSFTKVNDKQLSDTAQLYHHDMHRLGFVKVFIYLTDVDENSGPHTLVQKTHRTRPDHLWADGRHTDEAIAEAGIGGDEINITGKAGTVFLVDTSCLHKGAHPKSNARLMAQVQYVNSLFGKPMRESDRKVLMSQTNNAGVFRESADIVRKYAATAGVRFMQNFI